MSTTETDPLLGLSPADLTARREQLIAEARQLASSGEALAGNDLARFETVEREIDAIRQRREQLEHIAAVAARAENRVEGYVDPPQHHTTDSAPKGHRDQALRTIEQFADVSADGSSAHLEHIVRRRDPRGIVARYLTAVGSDAYERGFSKVLLDPVMGHLKFTPEEVAAFQRVQQVEQERALATTTTGIPIPYQLDPTLIYAGSGALNPLRQICRVETITEGTWKGVNTTDVTLAYSAEAAEATDNTPTLAQPSITAQRCIGFIPFSIEAGQDWGSLVQELTAALADGKDILDATAFLTGTGSNQPGGILNIGGTGGLTTTQRVQTATTATFVLGDMYVLKAALPARFFPRTTMVANPSTWDTVFRFTGGNSAEPLLLPTRDGNVVGIPKAELSTMATGTTTATKLIIAGDFRTGYLIADRLGMSVELVPHLFGATNRFPTGQRGLFAIWRTGGGVTATNALRYLEVK